MITFVKQENLRFVGQPAKSRRMQNAVTITLERTARWTRGLSFLGLVDATGSLEGFEVLTCD